MTSAVLGIRSFLGALVGPEERATSARQSKVFELPESRRYFAANAATYSISSAIECYAAVLRQIKADGKTINLVRPVLVSLESADSRWFAESSELDIYAAGHSEAEALGEFSLDFMLAWEGLKDQQPENLTTDAIQLKNRLAAHIGTPANAKN